MQTNGTPSTDHIEISVVAPMYNEEGCVSEFLRRTDAALRAIGVPHEIVIVSDGSTDGTDRLLREGAARYPSVRVLFLARNVGQCSALYAGIQASRGRAVVVTDGDLQHKPEDIPTLHTKLREGYTLVSGSRRGRKESLLTKRLPSLVANWLLRRVTGCEIRDMGGILREQPEELRAIREMPLPHIVESGGRDQVDLGLPLEQQRAIGREALECFT